MKLILTPVLCLGVLDWTWFLIQCSIFWDVLEFCCLDTSCHSSTEVLHRSCIISANQHMQLHQIPPCWQLTQINVGIVSVLWSQSSIIQAYKIWLCFKEKQSGIKSRQNLRTDLLNSLRSSYIQAYHCANINRMPLDSYRKVISDSLQKTSPIAKMKARAQVWDLATYFPDGNLVDKEDTWQISTLIFCLW